MKKSRVHSQLPLSGLDSKATITSSLSSSLLHANRLRRVAVLPEDTKTSLRASQVIGSLSRAIEELVRNSIEHGRSTVVDVRVGNATTENGLTTLLEVKDNGIGIDAKSTETWIGVNHCSSSNGNRNHSGSTASITSNQSLKGETLKSLAALSTEFRIITASREKIGIKVENKRNIPTLNTTVPSAPSKCRKRKQYSHQSSTWDINQSEEILTCEKVIQQGSVVSFKCTTNRATSITMSSSGTTVQLHGLFHNFAVRKRQYELSHQVQNDKTTNRSRLNQARSCIQILALAFPNVSIRLYDTGSKTIDTCWSRVQQVSGHKRASYHESMRHRLQQVCGENINPKQTYVEVNVIEKNETKSNKSMYDLNGSNCWSMQGVICVKDIDNENDSPVVGLDHASKQHEYIYMNGKLSKQNSSLSDFIRRSNRSRKRGELIGAYLLHITCPRNDVEFIVDDTRSYALIEQKTRLYDFLIQALNQTVFCEEIGCNDLGREDNIMSYRNPQTSLRLVSSKKVASSEDELRVSPNKGRRCSLSMDELSISPTKDQNSINDEKLSPFSQLFMENSRINRRNQVYSNGGSSAMSKKVLSVQEVLLQTNADFKERALNDELQWTRKRIKAIQSEIHSLTKYNSGQGSGTGLKISKDMLSNAEFIAQLDAKFIVVSMEGILCAIDQHAADERIGLERLEKALVQKLIAKEYDQKSFFNLSKKKCISTDNIFREVPLPEPTFITLTSSQFQIIKDNIALIKKWKFNVTINELQSELKLSGVPSLFDRVATSNDFIQFLQAIERRSYDVALVRPAFVKRILASYACRYAVMFGDILSEENCKQIIQDLSNCDMSFICAHGRPSVIPLIELSSIEIQAKQLMLSTPSENDNKGKGYVPIRFRKRKSCKS